MTEKAKIPAGVTILLTLLVIAVIVEGYFIYQSKINVAKEQGNEPPPAELQPPPWGHNPRHYSFRKSPFGRPSTDWWKEIDSFLDWDRLGGLINRLFEDSFGPVSPRQRGRNLEPFDFELRVDLEETADQIIVICDLPGMNKDKIDVKIENGYLLIRGNREEEKKQEEGGIFRRERSYGRFERVIPLPAEVDESRVQAEYQKGVLKVILPKTEPSPVKSKKIIIT